MLETYSSQEPVYYDNQSQNFDLWYFIGVIKRRFLYFAIPFLVIGFSGAAIIKTLPRIYLAEGEILVESPEISPDLVRPTITALADERFAIFRQRLMTAGNLLAVIDKFNLFPRQRASLSQSQLLDLMRLRVKIKPITLDASSNRNGSTFAFAVGFEHERPDVALKVANEFVTQILSEDASRRTNTASEATKFFEQEVKRLQGLHDDVVGRIEAIKQRPPDQDQAALDEMKTQMKNLATLEAELVEKSSVYSNEHPVVKNLQKKITALKRSIAAAPQAAAASSQEGKTDVAVQVLDQQQKNLEKRLEEANSKLTIARAGENMERNQQAERLRIIAYPELPNKPVKSIKMILLALVVGAAGAIGAGAILLAEILDGTIRRCSDLSKVVDQHLIVIVPYLSLASEDRRRRLNFILLCTGIIAAAAAAIVGVMNVDHLVDSDALQLTTQILISPSH